MTELDGRIVMVLRRQLAVVFDPTGHGELKKTGEGIVQMVVTSMIGQEIYKFLTEQCFF